MTSPPFVPLAPSWDQRYSQPGFLYGTEPNAYLTSQRHLLAGGRNALAVADGEGRNGVWLAQQGLTVEAFDLSPVAVDKARQLAQRAAVTVDFQVGDANSWAWPREAYDCVAAIFIQFFGPRQRQRLFDNIISSLKPSGYLILQGYAPTPAELDAMGPELLDHLYTEQQLRAELAGVQIVDFQAYQAHLAEHPRQVEPAALIGMVVQKPRA